MLSLGSVGCECGGGEERAVIAARDAISWKISSSRLLAPDVAMVLQLVSASTLQLTPRRHYHYAVENRVDRLFKSHRGNVRISTMRTST